MLCPGSPYPHHKVPPSPSLSQRSLRSGGSGSTGSRGRVVTYRTETTTTTGIFGRKKRVEAFQCQFERSVAPILSSAANRLIGEVVQSQRRPLLAFNQEKALVGAFSVIVKPVVEPMDRFAALILSVIRVRLTTINING